MSILLRGLFWLLAFLFPFGSANILYLRTYTEKADGAQNSILPVVFFACILVSLTDSKIRKQFSQVKKFILPLTIFYLIMCVSDIMYGLSEISLIFYVKLLVGISGFVIMSQTFIAYPQLLRQSLYIYAGVCCVVVLAFFAGLLDGAYFFSNDRLWIFGINPNTYSFMIGFALLIILYSMFQSKRRLYKIFAVIAIVFLAYFILLSGSRGTLLFLALLLAIMFHKRIVYMGIFGLLSVVIVGIVAKQLDYEIIVFNRMSEGSLVDGRAQLIDQSLTIFEQSPLLGVGESGYRELMSILYNENRDSHNIIISNLAMTGIVGTMIFLTFICMLLKSVVVKSSFRLFSFVIFLYMFLISLKMGSILTYSLMWWIYAVALSMNVVGRRQNSSLTVVV